MDLMEDKRGGGGGGRELSCEYRREARAARGAVEVVERESCESRCWSACGPVEQGALCTRIFEKQNMVCGTLF